MDAEKLLWHFGCKVGQSVPIGMKLELDVWHRIINVYTKFQIDISKHVKKNRKTKKKSKTRKDNRQNPKHMLFAKKNLEFW